MGLTVWIVAEPVHSEHSSDTWTRCNPAWSPEPSAAITEWLSDHLTIGGQHRHGRNRHAPSLARSQNHYGPPASEVSRAHLQRGGTPARETSILDDRRELRGFARS